VEEGKEKREKGCSSKRLKLKGRKNSRNIPKCRLTLPKPGLFIQRINQVKKHEKEGVNLGKNRKNFGGGLRSPWPTGLGKRKKIDNKTRGEKGGERPRKASSLIRNTTYE